MDPAPSPTTPRPLGTIAAVLLIALFVATIVYPIVAQSSEPPLEPAATLMYWQALWNDGYYGTKYNFAVSWFCLLAALFGPLIVGDLALGAWRHARAAAPLPATSGWHSVVVTASGRGAMVRAGLVVLVLSLGFGAICFTVPELLSPVGILAQIVLIVWPFALFVGPALLLDAAPPGVVLGPIEALAHVPAAPNQRERFDLRVGGRNFELDEHAWRSLTPQDEVLVRFSPAFHRVLELRVRPGATSALAHL